MAGAVDWHRELRRRLRPLRALARDAKGAALAAVVATRWRRRLPAKPHTLPAPLIVSLTSHPPRFDMLALALKALLTQSVAPDGVILWLTPAEQAGLPLSVRQLADIRIQDAPDIRSFKKIIPALARFPHAFIAIADDDVFYPPTWLEDLVAAYDPARREIPCHRAYEIGWNSAEGRPSSYADWRLVGAPQATPLTFATGVGGALYPAGSLDPEVRDAATFTTLCPKSDDLWLYWMARRAGWRFRKIGRRRHFDCWPGTQSVALQHENAARGGGNDRQISALIARYGFPAANTAAGAPDFAMAHAP